MKLICQHCGLECKNHKGLSRHTIHAHNIKYSYTPTEKHCGGCNKTLPSNLFNKNKSKCDGLSTRCAKCSCVASKKTRKSSKRKLYDKHYKENIRNNPELKEKHNKVRRVSSKKRYANDVCFRLRSLINSQIRDTIKSDSVLKYLPYTIQELKEHIENLFTEGMTWDNHGLKGWHIDHIYPQSKLIYDSMEHPNFLKCWSLDNLQPLWAKENMSKGNKIIESTK
tara:strand:+ start:192 stop:863 length:672 start_codon:yes stop_codon:yes gene_type:complete